MNDEVAKAVRALESSRAALAGALIPASPASRRSAGAAQGEGPWAALWDIAAASANQRWERSALRPGLERARPVIEDAVRRQPWTAVTVAALCGAVAIWIVSARRRWILSAAGLWWRTAGAAMLASVALKLYEQHFSAAAAQDGASSENETDPTDEPHG